MFLSTVQISNFRSFESLRLDLQNGFNVLVGRNNTGKTNLLQAIRHAVGPSASQGDALWLKRDDFYRTSAMDTTERTIAITLTFAGLTDAQRSHFYEIVDFNLTDLAKSRAIIRFEASWPKGKRQASTRRTGGPLAAEMPEVPTRILESLPITFLPALRDAEASLAPGYRSRLAALLREVADRKGGTMEDDIKKIFSDANKGLEGHPLINETKSSLQTTTKELAGSDYSASAIKAAEVEFEKILRSLQVQMEGLPIGALDANGLWYNNLLYMAVVLEHLKRPDQDECPLLLVEEPEAHLHPQLTMLLADYLANMERQPQYEIDLLQDCPDVACAPAPFYIEVATVFDRPTDAPKLLGRSEGAGGVREIHAAIEQVNGILRDKASKRYGVANCVLVIRHGVPIFNGDDFSLFIDEFVIPATHEFNEIYLLAFLERNGLLQLGGDLIRLFPGN
jgi:hypothetical protein